MEPFWISLGRYGTSLDFSGSLWSLDFSGFLWVSPAARRLLQALVRNVGLHAAIAPGEGYPKIIARGDLRFLP